MGLRDLHASIYCLNYQVRQSTVCQIIPLQSNSNDRIEFISPSIMIPEHRLASLLQQVKQTQISNCLYHNTSNSPSLYSDHTCDRNQFPSLTVELLSDHSDEVYCVKFSNDGTKMASASKDKSIIIWDVEVWKSDRWRDKLGSSD
jgi:WD40 repeat protein